MTGTTRINTHFTRMLTLSLLILAVVQAAAQTGYQKAPKPIADILNAPPTPVVSLSPTRDRMLLLESAGYPTIAELAEPMLRLGGTRVNPNTNGPHRAPRFNGLRLKNLADGKETRIQLPPGAGLGMAEWSPDGKHFAFTNTLENGIELWVGSAATGAVRRIPGVRLNAASGDPVQWMPDNKTLFVSSVPVGRGAAPAAAKVPVGPTVQENYGKATPAATFQDLLKNRHDEDLFDYYMTSQLQFVDVATGKATSLGKPGIYLVREPSPDGKHFLVYRTHRPYSYLNPSSAFPKEIEVWDTTGRVAHTVASIPLLDQIPIEGVPTGPRSVNWRPTDAATLVWVEALDGGDTRKAAPLRDKVVMLKSPFSGSPVGLARVQNRFGGVSWGARVGLVLVGESGRNRRWSRTLVMNADNPSTPARTIWDRAVQDRYGDPGTPVTKLLPNRRRAILQNGSSIYPQGTGATPQGDRPFLVRFDLTTLK